MTRRRCPRSNALTAVLSRRIIAAQLQGGPDAESHSVLPEVFELSSPRLGQLAGGGSRKDGGPEGDPGLGSRSSTVAKNRPRDDDHDHHGHHEQHQPRQRHAGTIACACTIGARIGWFDESPRPAHRTHVGPESHPGFISVLVDPAIRGRDRAVREWGRAPPPIAVTGQGRVEIDRAVAGSIEAVLSRCGHAFPQVEILLRNVSAIVAYTTWPAISDAITQGMYELSHGDASVVASVSRVATSALAAMKWHGK